MAASPTCNIAGLILRAPGESRSGCNPDPIEEYRNFVEGELDFNSFDNLAFQPGNGTLYVMEDHNSGDATDDVIVISGFKLPKQ